MNGSFQSPGAARRTTVLLAATAKRSDRPKRQLFIDPRTEADSQLPAQNKPGIEAHPYVCFPPIIGPPQTTLKRP
jgi:hypothetical protein